MKRLLLAALLGAGLMAGCGGGDDEKQTGGGSATTAEAPERGATPDPIERGFYAGVRCQNEHCGEWPNWHHYAQQWCKGGGHLGKDVSYSSPFPPDDWRGKRPTYVCFRVTPAQSGQRAATPNLVREFYVRRAKVLDRGHIQSDSFGTSENGWDVDGEWFDAEEMRGTYTSADRDSAYYSARWYGS